MLETFSLLRDLLNARERRQAALLLVLLLVLGSIELVGVASILPFIAVLSDPKIVQTNTYLRATYGALGFNSINDFLVFLAAVMFLVVIVRTTFTAFAQYAALRYANMRSHTLAVRLLSAYLGRPYRWFLNRHSADLGKTILSEVEEVIRGSLLPGLELIKNGIIAVFITGLIVAVQPIVALVSTVTIALAYGAVYFTIRMYILKIGRERVAANRQRYQISQEVLGGVKEVKIGGHERGYLRRFENSSLALARLKSLSQVMKQMPRYALELVALGGMLGIILALLFRAQGELTNVLPTISLYGFAALRLLPVLHNLYQAVVGLRLGRPGLTMLHDDLFEETTAPVFWPVPAPLPLTKCIEVRGVEFAYPKSRQPVLRDVTLVIQAQTTVGFIGKTGAGKSTIIDIILGLLEPQKGAVLVDGVMIDQSNVRAWQRSIGYVPQQIFLSDESIAANIAFGQPPAKIDMEAVERAARMANLHEFIMRELQQGYQTTVGERGIRLSGGQRQRIGIARALYDDPDILVLDEATSALDHGTERAVMEAIQNLAHRKTILMIAHRLEMIAEACDVTYLVKDQGIWERGSALNVLNEGTKEMTQ